MGTQAVVDRHRTLIDALIRTLETGEGAAHVFAPACFYDINLPAWRFQIQDPNAFVEWWHQEVGGKGRVTVGRQTATPNGFAIETEIEFPHHGRDLYARQMFSCEVASGRISELVVYCTGDWDPETRARHAAEAPMIRG